MISFRNVSFQYGDHADKALDNVSFDVAQGEFVVLAGVSGSGKTTVTRCINGLIPHFEEGRRTGQVLLDGVEVADVEMHEIARRVGSVFQDPRSQFFTINITDEVAFGCENLGIPRGEMRKRVDNAFGRFAIDHLRERSVFALSSGEKQKVAFASVYSMQPRVFVLDEPSSNLDVTSTLQLRQILQGLKAEGHTIVIAEHRLYYLRDLFDRVIYLAHGRVEREYSQADVTATSPAEFEAQGLRPFDLSQVAISRNNYPVNENLRVEARDLRFKYSRKAAEILKGVNLTFRGGEVVAVVGPNGAGKTTLLKVLSGLLEATGGAVQVSGQPVKAAARIKRSHLVMQDADHQLFTESVQKEMELGFKVDEAHRVQVAETLTRLNLVEFKDRHPHSLSGGQKQRLAVAVALVKQPEVIMLDEPTSGLDGRNMATLADLVRDMAGAGHVVIIATHDYELIARTCSRVMFLNDGIVQEDSPMGEVSAGLKQFLGGN